MRLTAIFAGVFIAMSAVVNAAEMGDDGLHKEPWFSTTFKDVAEDIEAATEAGKRLAIIFEQRGCAYCRKMHEEVFSDPKVAAYISENFMVVQYNLFGDEEVIDIDGEELSEKTAARKWRVVYTPTILFMPEVAGEDSNAGAAAVSVMPGAFGKGTTLHMFQWVKERGYEGEEHFQKYHARRLEEMGAEGKTDD
ncbi:thioredoxin fold domain-containing protein [Rhizobiales bacterium]|uniref:thioredoxin family protein n=1 Tax=Hongsoonwoonella zoysiae TaxID=2821844 RepID=UPI0015602B83|nr:thioredoxin family protein [Hongsoonwoonella zoysiae]NRG19307.1 thioredoxin fold domain-containing protein [Hongsoonwoonella zoysiae]